MDTSADLEFLIRRYLILGKKSPKGFEPIKCAVCNDYKIRGGFKFELGNVGYHCFNCSLNAVHKDEWRSMNKPMKDALLAFGIPEAEIDRIVALKFFQSRGETVASTETPSKQISFPTQEVPLPYASVPVSSGESPWCEVAEAYLGQRGLSSTDYPFFVSDETAFAGRLMIPYYFKGKIIYWQGRAMDPSIQPRYKNPLVEKENIFFNMDELYRYTDDPLFVTEGPLDAVSIGTTAIGLTGSTLGEFRLRELKRVKQRKVIFVIDKNLNGFKLGTRVLSEGWYITCFPDNYDDSNDVLKKLGKIWLLNHLASTAVNGFAGQLLLKMKCSS